MAILDLQDMKIPEEAVSRRSNRSRLRCGGGGGGPSNLSLLLC
jgi:hypothetical protein